MGHAPKAAVALAPDDEQANRELRDVLQSMQRQCGIKNLVLHRQVGGKSGTLVFRDVPCSRAFRIVLRMHGLASNSYENRVLHVGPQERQR